MNLTSRELTLAGLWFRCVRYVNTWGLQLGRLCYVNGNVSINYPLRDLEFIDSTSKVFVTLEEHR